MLYRQAVSIAVTVFVLGLSPVLATVIPINGSFEVEVIPDNSYKASPNVPFWSNISALFNGETYSGSFFPTNGSGNRSGLYVA